MLKKTIFVYIEIMEEQKKENNSQRLERLKDQVADLPLSAGVYQFVNRDGEVIYVGKAKSLRRRVASYFLAGRNVGAKVEVLRRQIENIVHIVVESEGDALLLENSLIKQLQPKYNILLKDDKSYPWIQLTAEEFPRAVSTRRLMRDGSQYFGPYSSITMQRSILEFIREVIQLRTCKLRLSEQSIAQGKFDHCLQYHLGNCGAPCVGLVSRQDYRQAVDMAASVLKGDLKRVRSHLSEEMQRASEQMNFELALRYKLRLDSLENYAHRSLIVSSKIVDIDIFSLLVEEGESAFCNFIRIRHGSIIGVYTVEINTGLEVSAEELLPHAIVQILERTEQTLAKEVIVPSLPTVAFPSFDGVNFIVPKRGEKLDLLQFSQKSARIYRAEQRKKAEIHNPERHADRLMASMQRELMLPHEPRHIECFDNSNLMGTFPVSSCVVFRNGKPSKKEYRHYNVKSVEGIDDFASMREVVSRRYSRLIEEGAALPDLIVVDGGKGQLSSAYSVLCDLGIEKSVPIVGLAKRIEEVFYPNDPMPFYLSRAGEPLKVICHLRDEAHRFAITFHRNKRSKGFIVSELDEIKGLGDKGKAELLKYFGSVTKIKEASFDELAEIVGKSRAEKVISHFSV